MTKTFSLKGKGLKLDTAKDVEPYLRGLIAMPDVEVVDISGNTWGIDAVKPFTEVLKGCNLIKVCYPPISANRD
jgi:Ran GTPase-activating protein 1